MQQTQQEIPKLKLRNIIAHAKTICHHKHLVRQHCFKMGLYRQGIFHDMSKFSPTEFWSSCRFYQGTRSPNAAERDLLGYSASWLHHKGRNKHHYEYWVDFARSNGKAYGMNPAKMPDIYIAEMIADRVAACKTYHKADYRQEDALEYYELFKQEPPMHPYTREKLELFLHMLAEKGEEETFRYIRKEFLHR